MPEISAVERRAETWPVWFRASGQVMQGKPKRGKGKSGERLDKENSVQGLNMRDTL